MECHYITNESYVAGYQRGLEEGYNSGLMAGTQHGYQSGYQNGYNAGVEAEFAWRRNQDQQKILAEYEASRGRGSPVHGASSKGKEPMLCPRDVLAHRQNSRIRRYRETLEQSKGFEDDNLWVPQYVQRPNNVSEPPTPNEPPIPSEPPTPDGHSSQEENGDQSTVWSESEVLVPSAEDDYTHLEQIEAQSDAECQTPTSTDSTRPTQLEGQEG